jgi:hemerythrin
METFVWDENFTTGLELVDAQHRRLVELINRLGDSLIAGTAKDHDALQAVFKQLADYAQYHFSEEEQLMLESGVSPAHRELHQRRHAEFVEQLSTMWNARRSMADPADTLHGFLRAWLAFHILGEDHVMAREITQRRAGNAPVEGDAVPKDSSTAALLSALHNLYHVLSAQNRDLAAVNVHLEERVAERTGELALANETLTDLNRRLETLSNTDGLLGIANRRHFNESLEKEWRRAQRAREPLSLLMIDVDYFKRYNDTHGHQAGDACLQSVTQAALSAMRRPADLLARYGGEELIVMLPDIAAEGAMLVAQEIRGKLAQRQIPHGDSPVSGQVTVSIGAATMTPGPQARPEELVAAADRALYAAKQAGRDRVCPG